MAVRLRAKPIKATLRSFAREESGYPPITELSPMFKITQQRHLDALDLAAAAQTFPEAVKQGLEDFFAAHLQDGERLPDFGFAQELVRRVLAATSVSMKQTDGSLTVELVSHAELRDRREQRVAELRELLRRTRFFFDQALLPEVVRQILPVRRLSNMKPDLLVAAGRQAAAALRDPTLGWKAGSAEQLFAPPAESAVLLQAAAERLKEILDLLARQRRSTQSKLGDKHADLDQAADATRRCQRFLDGLYRLAGLEFHADRLGRPRRRKKKRPEA